MASWLIVLFILQLFVGQTAGRNEFVTIERSARVFYALLQFGAVLLGYLAILVKAFFSRKDPRPARKAGEAFVLLFVWFTIAALAMMIGLVEANPTTYVVGDSYKFALLPLLFGLTYFGISTESQLWFVLSGLMLVLAAAILVNFVQNYSWILQGFSFTTSATYQMASLYPLLIYLLLSRAGGRWFRRVLWAIALEICISIVLVAGFSDYVSVTLAVVLYLLYSGNKKTVMGLILAGTLALVGILAPLWGWAGPFGPEGSYASRKLSMALSEGGLSVVQFTELLSGGRFGQVNWILHAYAEHPANIVFGFGMGGEVQALPVTLEWVPNANKYFQARHFFESSIFEVFYRTGLAGLLTLLAFFRYCYRRGRSLAPGPHRQFATFVTVNTVYQLLSISFQMPTDHAWLFLVVPVAGTFVLERSRARQQETTAPAMAHGCLSGNTGLA